jgi:hypothetical protein
MATPLPPRLQPYQPYTYTCGHLPGAQPTTVEDAVLVMGTLCPGCLVPKCPSCGAEWEEDGELATVLLPSCCPVGPLHWAKALLREIEPYVKHPMDTDKCGYYTSGFDILCEDVLPAAIKAVAGGGRA